VACLDLPQTSDAGCHLQAAKVFESIVLEDIQRVWARPNQAHLYFEHIPELRWFIQTVFSKEASNPSQPGIVRYLAERSVALVQMPQFVFLSASGTMVRNL
jgi:hypothetical protein